MEMTKARILRRIAGLGFALESWFALSNLLITFRAGVTGPVLYWAAASFLGVLLAAVSMFTEKDRLLALGSALEFFYLIHENLSFYRGAMPFIREDPFISSYMIIIAMTIIAWLLLFCAGTQPGRAEKIGFMASAILLVRLFVEAVSGLLTADSLPLLFAAFFLALSAREANQEKDGKAGWD